MGLESLGGPKSPYPNAGTGPIAVRGAIPRVSSASAIDATRRVLRTPGRRLVGGGRSSVLGGRRRRARPSSRVEVLSIDVFDTALVRTCGSPETLFLWLGRRLSARGLIGVTPEEFARVRQRVEAQVWEREGWLDSGVTLADFHRELVRVFRLPASAVDALVAEELALEEEVLRPTRQVADFVHAATSAGLSVVFASDTYFSAEFLQRQLEAHDLWPPGARCFASSEYGRSKGSGALFAAMARELGVPPRAILHVGDNPEGDVRSAGRARVRGRFLPEGRLNRYEALLDGARWETGGLTAAFAGASRLARMTVPASDPRTRAIRDVAAGVAGPLLAGYVLWLLARARDLGLERLYFVARDGEVLADLASILVRRLGLGLDVRYLYASRRAVNLAAVGDTAAPDLEWAFRQNRAPTLGDVLARLEVPLTEVRPEVAGAAVADCTEATLLTPDLRRRVLAAAASGGLRALILERAGERRRVVTDYLRQEGVLDDAPLGIVDLGGVGSQARALHELVRRGGGRSPHVFFLGLDENPDPELAAAVLSQPWLDDAESFMFDQPRRRGMRALRGLNTAFQMFSAADHGTVIGYEERGDRVQPVLAEGNGDALRRWGLGVVRETLSAFAEQVVLDDDLVDPEAVLAPALSTVVLEFMRRPTGDEARAWGAHPFEGGEVTGPTHAPLAPPYRWGPVLRAAVDGSVLKGTFPDSSWNSWHEGSVASAESTLLRASLRAAEAGRRRLKGARNPAARAARTLALRLRGSAR